MLKVIPGGRDALEEKALATIWLGTREDAAQLMNQLKPSNHNHLKLISDASRAATSLPAQEI